MNAKAAMATSPPFACQFVRREMNPRVMIDFAPYLRRWHLMPDGEPLVTRSAALLPVIFDAQPAMLKIAHDAEERRAGALLRYWEGEGAVRVFAQADNALLMERAQGMGSLADIARNDRDDEASRIICDVAARLHEERGDVPGGFVPLRLWFGNLAMAAAREGGVFSEAWRVADELLTMPRDHVALHGDLHHMNVLDGGLRGWLAIDPKCVAGERGFEFAVIFSNPDPHAAPSPARFSRQIDVVADASGLERDRLLRWSFSRSALSAAWFIADGDDPSAALQLAALAQAELAKSG